MNLKKISTQKELTGNNPQQMLFAEELTTTKPLYHSNSTRQEIEHKFKNIIHEELKLGAVVLIRRKQKCLKENIKAIRCTINGRVSG